MPPCLEQNGRFTKERQHNKTEVCWRIRYSKIQLKDPNSKCFCQNIDLILFGCVLSMYLNFAKSKYFRNKGNKNKITKQVFFTTSN